MASSKDFLDYILEKLSPLEDITSRTMMGEYILYYKGRIFGGIYDNRLLIKPVNAAHRMIPTAKKERPYEGAAEMIMPDEIDDGEFLCRLVKAMYEELPEPKKRKPVIK